MDLQGKVTVITGGSSGLGKEIALLFAEKEAKVIILARSETDLKSAADEIGKNVEYYACDISNATAVKNTISEIYKKYNKIDILINNAGIWFEGPFENHPSEKIAEIFNIVTLGTIYTTKEVLPIMKQRSDGQILNIVSVAGIETPGEMGQYAPYTAAKHAITGFTKATEEELQGTKIKVMGIYPGGMNTSIFKKAGFNYGDAEDWMMNKKDVAKIVLFMLSQPKDIVIDQLVVRKFN